MTLEPLTLAITLAGLTLTLSLGPYRHRSSVKSASVTLEPLVVDDIGAIGRTISGVRLCWELEEPKGPKGAVTLEPLAASERRQSLTSALSQGYRGSSLIRNRHPPQDHHRALGLL